MLFDIAVGVIKGYTDHKREKVKHSIYRRYECLHTTKLKNIKNLLEQVSELNKVIDYNITI